MKKLIVLLAALFMVLAFTAVAEESYTWEPSDDIWNQGSYESFMLADDVVCNIFVFNGWEPYTSDTQNENIIAQWNTSDGRALVCEIMTLSDMGVDSMESLVAKVQEAGLNASTYTLNGVPVCAFATDDGVSQRSVAAFIPGDRLFCVSAFLNSPSDVEEADNMLLSLMLAQIDNVSDEELTSYNWQPTDEMLANGSYEQVWAGNSTMFNVFVFNGWNRADSTSLRTNTLAQWNTGDGRSLMCGLLPAYEKPINSLAELAEMMEQQGNLIYDSYTINGLECMIVCSEDNLSQRGIFTIVPEGVFAVVATGLTDESQIDEVDNMLYSINRPDPETLDFGVKKEDLDLAAGRYVPIYYNDEPIYYLYIYNDYVLLPKEDSWDEMNLAGSYANDEHKVVDFYVYNQNDLGIYNVDDLAAQLPERGYQVRRVNLNGIDVAYYFSADHTVNGIALTTPSDVLLIANSPITDELDQADALQMLWSLCPAQ